MWQCMKASKQMHSRGAGMSEDYRKHWLQKLNYRVATDVIMDAADRIAEQDAELVVLKAEQDKARRNHARFLTLCRSLTGSLWPQNETTEKLVEFIEAQGDVAIVRVEPAYTFAELNQSPHRASEDTDKAQQGGNGDGQ